MSKMNNGNASHPTSGNSGQPESTADDRAEQRQLLNMAADMNERAKLEKFHKSNNTATLRASSNTAAAAEEERRQLLDKAANIHETDKLEKYSRTTTEVDVDELISQSAKTSKGKPIDHEHLAAVGVSAPPKTTTTETRTTNHDNAAAAAATANNNSNVNGPGPGRHPTVAQLVEGMDMLLPPMPELRRGTPNTSIAPNQPGAYAGTMAGNFQRMDHVDPNAVGNHPAQGLATLTVHTHDGRGASGNDGLVEAREVENDEENPDRALPMAREYDPSNPSTNKKGGNGPLTGLFVIAMLALLLGLYFGIKNNGKSPEQEVVPTTPSPTSLSPSLSPSAAPSAIMDDLYEVLPNYTKTSLQNYSSPQFQAWQWLEAHHNISGLPTWRKEQLFAMATFFHAMDGSNWIDEAKNGWMNYEVSECLWFSTVDGFVDSNGRWVQNVIAFVGFHDLEEFADQQPTNCDGNGAIKAISLFRSARGVADTAHVPPEISMLSSLSHLDLSRNEFGGKLESFVPTQLFELTNLQNIAHNANFLTGSLPTSIALLTNLVIIDFAANSLTGTLPSEIGRLTSLEGIHLVANQITGTLPTELGMWRNMTSFSAEHTFFSGTLPTELGQWERLDGLFLPGTPYLSGPIPSELGRLTMLDALYLSESSFTGAIPTELGLLTNMWALYLDDNSFSGTIPSELGLMDALAYMALSENGLTGTIPSEMLQFESLVRLWLGNNRISGTVPTEIDLLQSLRDLDLSHSLFSGNIPMEIGLLAALTKLRLSNNPFLTGPLPTEIGLLTDLIELHLANNTQLTGTLPSELGPLVSVFNLSVVDVTGNNNLTGAIAEGLCFLKSPNCSYQVYWWSEPTPCVLEFDCSASGLCGCDCPCPSD